MNRRVPPSWSASGSIRRVAHGFSRGGPESDRSSRPPPLKRWITQPELLCKVPQVAGRRRHPIIGIVVLLGAVSGCTAPPAARTACSPTRWDQTRLYATLQLADRHVAAGRFDRARRVLASFHDLPDARLQLTLARIDVEEGHYAETLRRLDGLARPTAEPVTYHRLRGVALEGLGQWKAAADAYEQAYRHEATVHLLVAWLEALALDGQPETARFVLQRERHRFPGEPAIYMLAARLWEQAGDSQAAIDELTTAALAQPESPQIRRRLAQAYAAAGRRDEAAAVCQEQAAESPDTDEWQQLRRRLASFRLSSGEFEAAQRIYRALVLTHPNDKAAWLGLATASLMADEPAEALEAALKVLRSVSTGDEGSPLDADARLIAALCYRRLDQPHQAIKLLSDISSDDDPDGSAQRLRTHWQ